MTGTDLPPGRRRVGVALKLAPGRPEVDALTGAVATDDRLAGPSDADLAALEWALRLADAWAPAEVVAVTAVPSARNLSLIHI